MDCQRTRQDRSNRRIADCVASMRWHTYPESDHLGGAFGRWPLCPVCQLAQGRLVPSSAGAAWRPCLGWRCWIRCKLCWRGKSNLKIVKHLWWYLFWGLLESAKEIKRRFQLFRLSQFCNNPLLENHILVISWCLASCRIQTHLEPFILDCRLIQDWKVRSSRWVKKSSYPKYRIMDEI